MAEPLLVKDKSVEREPIKVSPFRKEVIKTEPHKHNNYFEIIFLSKGSGYHFIDQIKYEVLPPIIFFVRREQVHNFELNPGCDPTGFVAIIRKSFIDKSFDDGLKALFSRASNHSCLLLQKGENISTLFELLYHELHSDPNSNFSVIEGLLKALLAKCLEVSNPYKKADSIQATDLYLFYLELLIANRPIKNKVAHYASLLHTTPQNLNAVCRKAVNESAGNILAEHLIQEAKRLLIYTKNTISEISYVMDFKDDSHFIKFFKRFTGLTPKAFRLIS